MSTLICYTSRRGATEQYMRWLAEDLGADVKKFSEVPRDYDFDGYDTIVVSSGTYASFMGLTGFLKRHWDALQGRDVVAVAVGAAPADDPWSRRSYESIPPYIREHIRYVKLKGRASGKADDPVQRENLDAVTALLEGDARPSSS